MKLSAYDKMLADQGLLITEGHAIGKSIVLLRIPPSRYKRFVLQCHCGKVFVAFASNIFNGRTKGCGCGRGKWKRRSDERVIP